MFGFLKKKPSEFVDKIASDLYKLRVEHVATVWAKMDGATKSENDPGRIDIRNAFSECETITGYEAERRMNRAKGFHMGFLFFYTSKHGLDPSSAGFVNLVREICMWREGGADSQGALYAGDCIILGEQENPEYQDGMSHGAILARLWWDDGRHIPFGGDVLPVFVKIDTAYREAREEGSCETVHDFFGNLIERLRASK